MLRVLTATLLTSLLTTAAAQSKTPPLAGQYLCAQLQVMLTNQMQFQPYSPNANSTGFAMGLSPLPLLTPSPLGSFTLDGKGKYVHSSLDNKEVGRGTYTFEKTSGKVTFTGSLAEVSKLKFETFKGTAKEAVFQFVYDKSMPIECSLITQTKGVPSTTTQPAAKQPASTQPQAQAPQQTSRVPNPDVTGVLTITAYDTVSDVDARTGKVLWSSTGGSLQRLPGGLMAYGLNGQLVIAKDKGEVLARLNGLEWQQNIDTSFLFTVSPDGTRILVAPLETVDTYFKRPNWQLMSPSGQVLAKRDAHEASNYLAIPRDLPAFLPDGRILIPNPDDQLLYVYDAQLRKQRPFVNEPSSLPVVSPDGQQVAMLRGAQVVVTDTSGKELKRLPVLNNYRITSLAFSPDSRKLAFLAIPGTLDYQRVAGYIDPNTGKMTLLKDAEDEPVTVSRGYSQAYRLSWWTGQAALPAAWKNGVPNGSAPAAPTQTTAAATPATARPSTSASAPRTVPSTASATMASTDTPASGIPWPAWLPQAKFNLGTMSGTLNLVLPVQQGEQRGISGIAKVNGQDTLAAFMVQGGLKMLAVQQADTTMRTCLITKETAATLSGMVFTAPNFETIPNPTGEECTITKQ